MFSTLLYGLIRTAWMGWSGLQDFIWEGFGDTSSTPAGVDVGLRLGRYIIQLIYTKYVSVPVNPVRISSPSPDNNSHTLGTKQHDVVGAVNLFKLNLFSARVGESTPLGIG